MKRLLAGWFKYPSFISTVWYKKDKWSDDRTCPHLTLPSSSSLISPIHRPFVCMWTVLVAGILSLAIVGVLPGARNWLAKDFSVEDWPRTKEIRDRKTNKKSLNNWKRPVKLVKEHHCNYNTNNRTGYFIGFLFIFYVFGMYNSDEVKKKKLD